MFRLRFPTGWMTSVLTRLAGPWTGAVLLIAGSTAFGQQVSDPPGRYYPLDQRTPPGETARWVTQVDRQRAGIVQPIRLETPGNGTIGVYDLANRRVASLSSPAQVGLAVGHTYRLRIADMPEFPGVELYPSIEVLDRLNPPPGQAEHFPVPVPFTEEEIELALNGRLITKVIYLEQPRLAVPQPFETALGVVTVAPHINLLAEADLRGRPMAIVRLGSRTPDTRVPDPRFWGTGGPVVDMAQPLPQQPPAAPMPREADSPDIQTEQPTIPSEVIPTGRGPSLR